ncbi:HHL244Cp [Eremothecium sinecaudum]|uniref:HHL244Cp n=1 Tax=Eremothecium sinecaudum TaxID=45286 RepID=A0A0X8HVK5_9SACH|nr:HHL244Cp [Eremothecium sinecaudum]AMD22526.1 HHL244Cp [Eremothecium sinecaudum]
MVDPVSERIMLHMNKEHKTAIEDYLVYYGKVPMTEKISDIWMIELEKDHFTLQFKHSELELELQKTIIFDPPLKDWSEAKPRFIEMSKEAAAGRGYSHIQVKDIDYPSVQEWLLIALIYLPVLIYFKRDVIDSVPLPEIVYEVISQDVALLGIIAGVFICHNIECYVLLRPRLVKYRVPKDYSIDWYFFGLLEGYSAIKRFDRMVQKMLENNA